MPNGKHRIVVVGLSFLVLAFTLAGRLVEEDGRREKTYEDLATFTEVLELVNSSYVDPVEGERLMSGAFRGMLASLDPNSGWLSPAEMADIRSDEGRRRNSGIEATKRGGYAFVAAVREGSPGERADVHAGEYIRTINGRSTREMSIFQVRRALTGEPGSRLSLNLFGNGEGRTVTVDIEPYDSSPLTATMADQGIYHLRVHYLDADTPAAVAEALRSAPEGARTVLLDLRDTVGGERADAVALADLFLAGGLVVRMEERGAEAVDVPATDEVVWDGPLSVLVNRMSAGSVEIAVAALKDRGRAEILGEATFGDATLQRLIQLPDESALILSVGRYLSPEGVSWADEGVSPDVSIPAVPADAAAAAEADSQLERALEHLAAAAREAA